MAFISVVSEQLLLAKHFENKVLNIISVTSAYMDCATSAYMDRVASVWTNRVISIGEVVFLSPGNSKPGFIRHKMGTTR